MSVYVDPLIDYGIKLPGLSSTKACHMATDGNLEELHQFANSIGLKREWFQGEASIPHYDLTPNKRWLAVKQGAVELAWRDFLVRCKRGKA